MLALSLARKEQEDAIDGGEVLSFLSSRGGELRWLLLLSSSAGALSKGSRTVAIIPLSVLLLTQLLLPKTHLKLNNCLFWCLREVLYQAYTMRVFSILASWLAFSFLQIRKSLAPKQKLTNLHIRNLHFGNLGHSIPTR
jgi:hypothetical protein